MRLTNAEKDVIAQYADFKFKSVNDENSLKVLQEIKKAAENIRELSYSIHSQVLEVDLLTITELFFRVKDEFYPNLDYNF
ncbi:MAG: hypothetical protein PHW73_04845 [Atribacterota bacterium]|nr:hypothetical protein [Atribacterota bacterium]